MDDLVTHFGGLTPDILYPHSASPTAADATRVSSTHDPIPHHSRSSGAPLVPHTPSFAKHGHTEPPMTTLSLPPLQSSSIYPRSHNNALKRNFVKPSSLRGLSHLDVSPSKTIDEKTEIQSELQDSDDEPSYIRHFENDKPSAPNGTFRPQPRRNLLIELAVTNGDAKASDGEANGIVNGKMNLDTMDAQIVPEDRGNDNRESSVCHLVNRQSLVQAIPPAPQPRRSLPVNPTAVNGHSEPVDHGTNGVGGDNFDMDTQRDAHSSVTSFVVNGDAAHWQQNQDSELQERYTTPQTYHPEDGDHAPKPNGTNGYHGAPNGENASTPLKDLLSMIHQQDEQKDRIIEVSFVIYTLVSTGHTNDTRGSPKGEPESSQIA